MSQSSDVFRHLDDEECQALITKMRDDARPLYKQLEAVAAATMRVRPVFLGKQPLPKRCQMIRTWPPSSPPTSVIEPITGSSVRPHDTVKTCSSVPQVLLATTVSSASTIRV